MGCLNLDVGRAGGMAAEVANRNGLAISCNALPISLDAQAVNAAATVAVEHPFGVETKVKTLNIMPMVSLWMVCGVNRDKDVFLCVTDGKLMEIEGQYLTVLKS